MPTVLGEFDWERRMSTVRAMPLERPDQFRPPPDYDELRKCQPVAKVSMPGNREAWLITRHHDVKVVLTDPRFGLNSPDAEVDGELSPMDDADGHQRFRRLVSGLLTQRRINEFQPRVEEIAQQLTREMLAKGPGINLVTSLSRPLPLSVITELLGIEVVERDRFHAWVEAGVALVVPPDDPQLVAEYTAIVQELWEYMDAIVEAKQEDPGVGLLGEMVQASLGNKERFSKAEQINTAITILITGYITTANALSIGIVDMATSHGFHDLTDDDKVERAAEEVLRRQSGPGNEALPRWAHENVMLGDQQIAAGDMVIVRLEAANYDPDQFIEPEKCDLARATNPHLAFGYGRHHCLGARLARIEISAALRALATQCPNLTLACGPDEITWTGHPFEDGPATVPVTW